MVVPAGRYEKRESMRFPSSSNVPNSILTMQMHLPVALGRTAGKL